MTPPPRASRPSVLERQVSGRSAVGHARREPGRGERSCGKCGGTLENGSETPANQSHLWMYFRDAVAVGLWKGLKGLCGGKKGEGNALSQCRVCAAFQPAISAESSSALLSPPALQSQRRAEYFP